ncbi:MAG TPA: NB-ARC domain-containing protein, partial [Xenococcaceae cyanobacterium]
EYNYESEYIKSAGCELWKLISQAFNQQINKSNFVAFIKRIIIASSPSTDKSSHQSFSEKTAIKKVTNKTNWTTAPDVSHLLEKDDDINTLVQWSEDERCRCIAITGMIGSGKTTLATKFAYKQQEQFDYVIWLSTQDAPSLKTLLKICLEVFDSPLIAQYNEESISSADLLVELISYLQQYKCLLILDELQEILERKDSTIYYRQGYEQYGQLIRSIITTKNQTLLVLTSRVHLKLLDYYEPNQVRCLSLGQFNETLSDSIFAPDFDNIYFPLKWSDICQYYLYNPQLLKIVANNLKKLSEINVNESIKNIVSFEEIDNLLRFELNYLSRLEKEIIHWLAIDCKTKNFETLMAKLEQPTSKIKLLEALDNLQRRSLITKSNYAYILAPLVKDYIQRKVTRLSLQS